MTKTFRWYEKLKLAIQSPDSQEMDEIVSIIRNTGVYELRSTELRQACTSLLKETSEQLSKPSRWLLERLQNAGHQPPYPQYVGVELLAVWDNPSVLSSQMAKDAFRLIYELISHLLELPQLRDHPRRKALEKSGSTILEKCREVVFARDPTCSPPAEIIQFSLLPESGIEDELIFLRVVQGSELVFGTAKSLVARAIESTAYGDALQTLVNLHWAIHLMDLLLPLFRLLAPMPVEHWLQIRPLIVDPSAIQSMNFHSLSAQLGELERILKHPRYQDSQRCYLPLCQDLLRQAISMYQTWDKAHHAIAAKYGQATLHSKPEGVQWLEDRNSPPCSVER